MNISGGNIFAMGTNNDGIDSNSTLTISGGVVIACGTTVPEDGFDCDDNTFTITGGTLIGIGGSTSTPTESVTTQPVAILGGSSLSSGQYISKDDQRKLLYLLFGSHCERWHKFLWLHDGCHCERWLLYCQLDSLVDDYHL